MASRFDRRPAKLHYSDTISELSALVEAHQRAIGRT